jgi:hypothetical protein
MKDNMAKRRQIMGTQQIILLIINILGGAAVIGSYIYGLRGQDGGANVLWGGVPAGIRPVYTVSMIISALGYFAFMYFLLFRLNPSESNVAYSLFFVIFLLILVASAFWMPLTNMYVNNPGVGLWIGVRAVLALVGLGAIALVWALISLQLDTRGVAYWLAVAGAGYFAFHTAILDAIVWAALFK